MTLFATVDELSARERYRSATGEPVDRLGELQCVDERVSIPLRLRDDLVPADLFLRDRMRNRLVHAYFDIDQDIVWVAAPREAPALREALVRVEESL